MKRKNFIKKYDFLLNYVWLAILLAGWFFTFKNFLPALPALYQFITHLEKTTNQVILLSLLLYGICLFLPSYGKGNRYHYGKTLKLDYDLGWITLIFGLLLGWADALFKRNLGALAVYANLFYYYIIFRLMDYELFPSATLPIYATLVMLILASLTFIYCQSSGEISSSKGERVTLWGWGAIVWLLSLFIVASLVVMLAMNLVVINVLMYGGCVAVVLAGVALIQYKRYLKANTLERQAYFDWKIALITKKMSGILYNPPPNIPITADTVIEIDTNINIDFSKEFRYQRYLPNAFNYQGTFYKNHYLSDYSNRLIEISPPKPADYFYHFNKEKLSHEFLITDNHDRNHHLWHETVYYNKTEHQYYPDYDDKLIKLFAPLSSSKKKDINTLIDELIEEKFTTNNGDYHFELDKKNQRLIFNDKQYIISGHYMKLEDLKLYCSANYAVIINSTITFSENNRFMINAWLFQLQPSKPLIYYNYIESQYDLLKKPINVTTIEVKSVRFGYYDQWNRHPNQDFIDKEDFLIANANYVPMLIVKTPYGELAVRSQVIGDVNVEE